MDSLLDATSLSPDATSPFRARRFVEGVLLRWGCAQISDDVGLLTSELVTNAVLHARSGVDLTVRRTSGAIRVEVADGSSQVPVMSPYQLDAQTGRGLALVDSASRAWGVEPRDCGKVVWFEVEA